MQLFFTIQRLLHAVLRLRLQPRQPNAGTTTFCAAEVPDDAWLHAPLSAHVMHQRNFSNSQHPCPTVLLLPEVATPWPYGGGRLTSEPLAGALQALHASCKHCRPLGSALLLPQHLPSKPAAAATKTTGDIHSQASYSPHNSYHFIAATNRVRVALLHI